MRATVVGQDRDFAVMLGEKEIGRAKLQCDAQMHANAINDAIDEAYDEAYNIGYRDGHSDGHQEGYLEGSETNED